MGELDGKVAIVTGAGRERGIGVGAAIELARNGASVVLTDVARPVPELEWFGIPTVADDMAGLEQGVAEIESLGGTARAIAVDVRSEEEIRSCVERTIDEFGKVDILFNNAGTPIGAQPFLEMPDDVWQQSWLVNVMGMVWFSRAVIPVMQQNGSGTIINNSSIAGIKVWPDFAAYSATKFAVIGLTRSLALDFGKDGIRVNAVCPGDIDTQMGDIALQLVAMQEGITVADVEGQAPDAIALGRRGLGEDVGRVVAWLAGPGSGYVSGVSIPVEGAWAGGL